MRRFLVLSLLLVPLFVVGSADVHAQGVTTSSVGGIVRRPDGQPLPNAEVVAVHVPSNTTYRGTTRADGRFTIPGMRVGGPYRVTVTYIGFGDHVAENVFLNLGVMTDLEITMREAAVALEGIDVEAERDAVFSSDRTGAATSVTREALATLPTITGELASVVRLTPQSAGGLSFAGQDPRLNNITVDGSSFNNSFGLRNVPGETSGVAPISLAAIEQIQVNVAPYDVRQGNFVGAGVNTVTRSGTNEFSGSLYYLTRDNDLVGTEASGATFDPGTFSYDQIGGWASGPIVRDKLFFFFNYEDEGLNAPGTTFRANLGSEPIEGGVTRVLKSDLDELSQFLATNFDYATGPYEGYEHETPGRRLLAKLDYNLNERNKLSVRYNMLDSQTDVLASNSSSLGWGGRRTNPDALNFQNSNYIILEDISSVAAEWNGLIGDNMANNLIVSYSSHDESRDTHGGAFFPMVDIKEDGDTYTTFGFEPFTPNNELRYKSLSLQNSFSIFGDRHSWTFGVSAERYESENVFFPGSQSAYVYESLDDFYTDANDFLANPNRTTSPVTLRRFQLRWSNIPGQDKPIQPLEVFSAGIYAQDEFQVSPALKLTAGFRLDVPWFGDTGFDNAQVDGMTFQDENGDAVQYATDKLPGANLLFSPRLGFNWDATGDRSTQVRGGTGIFTGRPAYVWISNQIGENGVLTGFEQLENTTDRPFHPDPDHYKPGNVTGDPAASYGLAFTQTDFKFPQIWRTNIAVDQRLPWDMIGTAEFLYSRDVNGIYYINANLTDPDAAFTGPDDRPRWTSGNRIVPNVTSAIVLKNQSEGYSWMGSLSLEKPFDSGLFVKAGYSYGITRNTIDPGSIAFGSWNNNQHVGDPNNPGVAYSANSLGHRVFGAASLRREYFDFGATTVSLFLEGRTQGNASYTYQGDLNGDGGTSNDLLYIPRDMSEMNFQEYSSGGETFTADEQAAAFEAYIQQDDYLREHRGEYAERGAVFMPMAWRADLSIAQEIFRDLGGRRNSIQLRADILNFTNFLNSDWGVGDRFVSVQPLIVPSSSQGGPADPQGQAWHRFRAVGGELMSETFEKTAGLNDVYRIQFSIRYNFN